MFLDKWPPFDRRCKMIRLLLNTTAKFTTAVRVKITAAHTTATYRSRYHPRPHVFLNFARTIAFQVFHRAAKFTAPAFGVKAARIIGTGLGKVAFFLIM